MALALDGYASGVSANAGALSASLTTTQTGDVILAAAALWSKTAYAAPSFTLSGGGLTWTLRSSRVVPNTVYQAGWPLVLEVWWALAPGALSSAPITATLTNPAGENYCELVVLAVSGANASAPFDANVSLPEVSLGNNTVHNVSPATSNSNAFIFAALADDQIGATIAAGADADFSLIASVANGTIGALSVEYQIADTLLAGATQNVFAAKITADYIAYIDAIQAAGGSEPSATGDLAANEPPEAVAIAGTLAAAPTVTGSLSATEPPDLPALVAAGLAQGGLAASEPPDTPAFAGGPPAAVSGDLAAGEPPDAAAFAGAKPATALLGLLAGYEAADRAAFRGRFFTTGFLDATEAPDRALFSNINAGSFYAKERPDRWLATPGVPGILFAREAPDRALFTVYARHLKIGDEPMTSILEGVTLPEAIERDAKGGPTFNTSIFIGANGAEYRSINWPRQLGKWSLSLGYREDTDPDFQAVLNLFYACRGRAFGFKMRDWSDFTVNDSPLGLPATVGGPMQIQKVYWAGSTSFARKITRPRAGTVIIRDLGAAVVPGVTVDYTTGLVTGAAAGYTCSCEFDVAVRFDTDALEIDVERQGLVNAPALDLVELAE